MNDAWPRPHVKHVPTSRGLTAESFEGQLRMGSWIVASRRKPAKRGKVKGRYTYLLNFNPWKF